MKFKIRNEYIPIKILLIVLPILWFISLIGLPLAHGNVRLWGIAIGVCAGLLALLFLTLIPYFVDKAIGAVIEVDDTTVKVSSLFLRKKILIDEIEDMETEEYRRTVIHHTEYRMKLIIIYGGGKKLILKDNASEIKGIVGFLTGERTPLPYQEIPVYQAYIYIKSKMK